MFDGDVDIDESLFGKKVKYHKGKVCGMDVWVFGIFHRESKVFILFPVDKRFVYQALSIISSLQLARKTVYSA